MSITISFDDDSREGLRESQLDKLNCLLDELVRDMSYLSAQKIEIILKAGVEQKNPKTLEFLKKLRGK